MTIFRIDFQVGEPAISALKSSASSGFSVPRDNLAQGLKYLVSGNHERGRIAFRFVQDTNAALAKQGDALREGEMTNAGSAGTERTGSFVR